MVALSKDVPQPTEIKPHQKSRVLEVAFAEGKLFRLPCEFLRVFSPSAEVRGPGPDRLVGNAHPAIHESQSTNHESRVTHFI